MISVTGMEHWCNDPDNRKPIEMQKNLSQSRFFNCKTHMDQPRIKYGHKV
jgi:hypothetical protein